MGFEADARDEGAPAQGGWAATETAPQFEGLGPRIRTRRKSLRFTLDSLAARAGVSKSYLSRIENGKKTPPLDTLSRLARALGTDIKLLLSDEGEGAGRYLSVVRVQSGDPAPRASGYAYRSLARGHESLRMQPYLIRLPPEFPAPTASQHDGQEFMHVLRGRVEWDVGGETFVVGPGDSVYLDSRTPHRARALDGEAEALVVVAPWQGRDREA